MVKIGDIIFLFIFTAGILFNIMLVADRYHYYKIAVDNPIPNYTQPYIDNSGSVFYEID